MWVGETDFYPKFVLFVFLLLYVPVNSYGHYGMVSSPNHTFSWENLNKRLTTASCTYLARN